jgi:hypothetical protein
VPSRIWGANTFSLTPIFRCHILQRSFGAGIAQSVEQGTENPRVGGSIPPPGTFFCLDFERARRGVSVLFLVSDDYLETDTERPETTWEIRTEARFN